MRILQVSSAKTYGGGERHMADLCRGLQERGHEVFVALRPTNEWEGQLDFIPHENFLHVSIRNSFGMFSAKRIGNYLKEHKIDIIHAHVARDYLAAGVACRISSETRLVLTRHVMFPLKPFHKFALNNVDAAIAVSPAVATQLEKIFPAGKINVIYNGLTVGVTGDMAARNAEFRSFHGIPDDALVVGTIGELKPLKGQRDFVLAANEIAKTNPKAYFVVAGKDNTADKRFRRELRRLVKVFGLADRFLWLDWLDDTSPFFAATDVFVSPSHSESFGLALLEAMSRGKAVVATATDGAKELLGNVGKIVPIADPVALADAVSEMLADKDLRINVAEQLRAIAEDRFSLTRMIDATENLYRDVTSDTARSIAAR
ncbi:MAG: glycosyltransferase family 4 protein [Pyrinomonadaceae bacterium]|nr:glycosyltransferase family 4 protein [Pyrinomonadaceae bacterium]MBP6212920.1 glycosyltransferase family 4 protein [Pyrinomonadaceae bacterium]